MTDIDPRSDIELSTADWQVMVRVPLAGQVSSEWLRCYQRLARATGVPVQAQAHPDRAWIVVSVPADGNQKEVAALDAARALIAEADAAGRAPSTAQAEKHYVTGGPGCATVGPAAVPPPGVPRAARPGRGPAGLASPVLRLPLPRLHQRHRVQPDRCDAASAVGQAGHDGPGA